MRQYQPKDDSDILKDGESLRVTMLMRDHATDATKPTLDAREQAREQWITDMSNAWKGAAAKPLVLDETKSLTGDAREDVYQEMVQRLRDAWRS